MLNSRYPALNYDYPMVKIISNYLLFAFQPFALQLGNRDFLVFCLDLDPRREAENIGHRIDQITVRAVAEFCPTVGDVNYLIRGIRPGFTSRPERFGN